MLLVAKLVVTPLLVWAAGMAMRRYGGIVAGMLVGFPVMTAPVAFFLALEQGPDFAARSAVAILLSLSGVTAFAIVYAAALSRFGWIGSNLLAVIAYFAVASAVCRIEAPAILGWAAISAFVGLGLALVRRAAVEPPPPPVPWWDIWLRMVVVVLIVLAITAAANRLGPSWSAVPATFPAITSVVTPFTHARAGAEAARRILRGVLLSHVSFALLFLIVAATVARLGPVASYAIALTAALATSAAVFAADGRLALRRAVAR